MTTGKVWINRFYRNCCASNRKIHKMQICHEKKYKKYEIKTVKRQIRTENKQESTDRGVEKKANPSDDILIGEFIGDLFSSN